MKESSDGEGGEEKLSCKQSGAEQEGMLLRWKRLRSWKLGMLAMWAFVRNAYKKKGTRWSETRGILRRADGPWLKRC